MELINNIEKTLRDDLSIEIKDKSKVSIAAACFSIYAFQELKKQLASIDELRFIFTSPTFITEKAKKEKREFYIPRLNRERSLYGTEFEIKLRNELTQKAIARECAEWIKKKVTFKSNISDKTIQGGIVVDDVGYTPINNFTTIELGCEKGNVISTTIVKDNSLAKTLLADFNEIWNDNKVLQEVTDEVIDSITAAYNENSPDFIYFVTLYNIFNEFLEDVSEDVLPNEATGFKDSKIWSMLYNFQKDAALAIINKLEKYNGCILADSVGLGKTFTALAVIKYYENRNKSVLVLCPKKLTNNWNTYKDNYVNNPIASDRLRYDVLYHTDLNRTHGKSNGLDLDRLNWGNYDLVVIDESHNFRNGGKIVENPDENDKENRYVKLLKKVIRAGVKTKVLMLSATPVNNRFNDLKNQLALAYEGHTEYIDDKLNTTRSIDDIFKNAQRAFNTWSKWEPCDRTTDNLLKMLDFDFFEVLDSVTIARSRKHIQKYYDTSDIGTFPTRLKPISLRPHLTDLKSAITYNQIFEQLMLLTLTIYTPTHFILRSKMEKYAQIYEDTGEHIDTVFEKAILIDKRNKNFESEKNYALLLHGKSKNINVTIPYSEEQISFEEAEVKLIFLCSNYKKVTVSYQIGKENKLYLEKINVCKMTLKEYEKTVNIINVLLEKGIQTRKKEKDERQEENEKEEIPSYLNANIQDYSKALHKEIRYLKCGRGKRYKIVDGIKINRDEKGIFTYAFELETELHLPEDAPVVVDTINGIHSVGTVLVCEDFQIMLLLNQELGDKIRIAYLMVEPWKLLEALDNKITSLNPQMHQLAIKLLEEGPKIATTENILAVPKGQVEVVRKLKKDNIVAVWGPPGTGKTYTMAQIAKNYIKQDKSVLIVSHSNVSVDGVVKKVIRAANIMIDETGSIKVIDFGFGKKMNGDQENNKASVLLNWPASKVPREIYKEQYGAQTEIFYVGYLIKNIIEKYDIKCFKYEMLLEKMIRVDPAERMVSFEKIQNSIAEQTFEQVKFSYKEKKIYQDFASAFCDSLSKIKDNLKVERDTAVIIEKLRVILRDNSLEEYISNIEFLISTFIKSNYKYYKTRIEVEKVRGFYDFFIQQTDNVKEIILNNLYGRVANIPVINSVFDEELPFN